MHCQTHVAPFLRAANDENIIWSLDGLQKLSSQVVPPSILGKMPELLQGDINKQWAQWFLRGICNIQHAQQCGWKYPQVNLHVRKWLEKEFGGNSINSEELINLISRAIFNELQKLKNKGERRSIPFEVKQELIDICDGKPFCWICGYKFRNEAISNFLDSTHYNVPLPKWIDIFKPIGLTARDIKIEIDHIVPISAGGETETDNLRISCGWCNCHKSAHSSLYDVSGSALHGKLKGKHISLPQPFWVIRLLSVIGSTLPGGNDSVSTSEKELTIIPQNSLGQMTPANLLIVSYDDARITSEQIQPRDEANVLWNNAKRNNF